MPGEGPLLIVGNHDSYWDPVVIGIAAIKRRQIRALAKSSLWKVKGLGRVLDGMGQIPILRGSGDAGALDRRSPSCAAAPASGSSPRARAASAASCARAAGWAGSSPRCRRPSIVPRRRGGRSTSRAFPGARA